MTLTEILTALLAADTALAVVVVAVALRLRSEVGNLRNLVTAHAIVSNKRMHTIDEQALMLVEMDDRNERLREDLRRMRERLPNLTRDEALAMDADEAEDPARPYIPTYDTGYLSLSPEIQGALEKDWIDRHMGDDPS